MALALYSKSIDKKPIIERVNKIANLIKNSTDLNNSKNEFEHLFYGDTKKVVKDGTNSIGNLVYNSITDRCKKKPEDDTSRLDKNIDIKSKYLEFKTTKILVDLSILLKSSIENNKTEISEDSIFNEALTDIDKICSSYLVQLKDYYKKNDEPSNNIISQSTNEPSNSNTVSQSISSMPEVTESSAKNPLQNKNNGPCCEPKVTRVPCPHYPE